MIECGHIDLADVVQQIGERGRSTHPAAQRQRVDEHPDQWVQIALAPTRDRGPDDDVLVGAGPDESDREQGVDGHEHRRAVPTGEVSQSVPGGGVERRRQLGTRVVPNRGARPVHRQLDECRHPGETGSPVVELTCCERRGVGGVPEPMVLPHRVVDVLDRQGRPAGFAAGRARLVCGDEVGDHRRDRATVADDVVHHQDQDHGVVGDADQAGPNGRTGFEVESTTGDLGDGGRDVALVGAAHVDRGCHPDVVSRVSRGRDDLLGSAVHRYESRAQHLMSRKQIRESRGDDRRVRGPVIRRLRTRTRCGIEAEHGRDEIPGPARIQRLQKPDSTLCGRQREHPVAAHSAQGHPAISSPASVVVSGVASVDDRCQTPDRRIGEHISRGDRRAEMLGCPGGHPGSGERVATEIEQRRGDPDVAHAQDLGDQCGQGRLGRAGGRLGDLRAIAGPRIGQRAAIELAVHGERQSG